MSLSLKAKVFLLVVSLLHPGHKQKYTEPYLLTWGHPNTNLNSPNLGWLPQGCHKISYFFCCLKSLTFAVFPKQEGFPGGASGKEPICQCRRCKRHGFDPWAGRSPGGGHGNPLQYSCLEKLMDRGAWWATIHGAQRVAHDWSNLACTTLLSSQHSVNLKPF